MEHVYPGRIDAGFCAGDAPPVVREALLDGRKLPGEPGDFEKRAAETIGLLRGNLPADHVYRGMEAWPGNTGVPEIRSFGTGRRSAELAASHGTAFGYSLFHHFSQDDPSSIELYRDQFITAFNRPEPLVAVAIGGICAETCIEAESLRSMHKNTFLIPTVVGSPKQCRERIESISERYATTDIVFLDLSPDVPSRLRSVRLLADEFQLAPSSCPPSANRMPVNPLSLDSAA